MLNRQWCLVFSLLAMIFLEIAYSELLEAREFAFKREFENPPPPFEKFYVDYSQITSTPFGTYVKHENGHLEKVRAIMNDCYGTYVMRVETQCPLCGQCYTGKCSPEGTCCPLYDKEVFPGIWTSP